MTTVESVYRPQHGLTEAGAEIFDLARYAILGTENPDGSAHVVPVMFRLDDERVLIQTAASTRKVRNINRCGRATVLVQDPRVNGEAWASGSGPAVIIRGDRAQQLGRRIRARYLTALGEQELGRVLALCDDTTIVVTPQRWMTWDTTGYNAIIAEHGLSFDAADQWFR